MMPPSWPLVIAALIAAPIFTPCETAVYGGGIRPSNGGGAIITDSTAGFGQRAVVADADADADADAGGEGGGAGALRRFVSTRALKTGTTIAGVVFEGGVVIGADTRATGGKTVCDRNCDKIHVLASNIACCGAGTSADAVKITKGARVALLRMAREMQACLPSRRFPTSRAPAAPGVPDETNANDNDNAKEILFAHRDSGLDVVQRRYLRVAAAAFLLKRHLFRYQGVVSAELVLGGVDATGGHIYQIHQGGSFAKLQFTAMGSGSLAALSSLERGHRDGLTEQEAKELVLEAIAAGIENDLGSGSNIDLCVITSERGVEHHRGAWKDPGLAGAGSAAAAAAAAAASRDPAQGEDLPAASDNETNDGHDSDDDGAGADDDDADSLPNGGPETTAERRNEGKTISKRRRSLPPPTAESMGTESGQGQDQLRGPDSSAAIEVGGEGGSRAWLGSIWRRKKGKSVVRVDHEMGGEGALRSFRCSALDDKVEVL